MSDWAVSARFGAVDKFSGIIDKLGGKMADFGDKMEGAWSRANRGASIFKSVLGANLVTLGIEKLAQGAKALVQSIPDFAERAQGIQKTATTIGMSADAIQRLDYAAKIADVDVEGMHGAMQKLNMVMGQGQRGMGPLIQQMSRLNPALAMQLRRTTDSKTAFLLIAQAIKGTTSAQARAALEVAAFGRAGQGMNNMLALGREQLLKLMAAAPDVIPERAIESSEKFAINMKILKEHVQGVKDQVLSFVVTALTPYLEKAIVWLQANKDIIATKIEQFIDRTAAALESAKPAIVFLWDAAKWLIKNWPLLVVGYGAWTAAQMALDTALLASGIPEFVIAVTALTVGIIYLIKYWNQITEGVASAWNWFNKFENRTEWWAQAVNMALRIAFAPLFMLVDIIKAVIDLVHGDFKSALTDVMGWARPMLSLVGINRGTNAGYVNTSQAMPSTAPAFRFINQISVDNTGAPGVTSTVQAAPSLTGSLGGQRPMAAGAY